MDRYYRTLRGAVEGHGGTVVKLMGDGVMAAFGVPRVSEDDAIRALRAGVAMQEGFRELARTELAAAGAIGLRVGINTGEVVVAADNTDVVGDPVNVAARLQAEAHDGQVVIGESTRRLVAAQGTLAPLGSFALKGRAEAIKAYRVESLERPVGTTSSAFVGRDDEPARLLAVHDAAIGAPAARLAVLLGSPGLGKSRLIEEVTHRLGDAASVVTAHCDAAGGATFAPVAAALRVTLSGLDAGAAMRLAANVIGAADLPAAVAAKVLATSEGNPLFVAELVRMLLDEGALERQGERWIVGANLAALEMPPTIHALLAARIERLGPEDRAVLERAAVVGRHFSRSAVAALLGRNGSELNARLEALQRTELIDRDTGWFLGEPVLRFPHVLIRDAAYRRLLKGTRAEQRRAIELREAKGAALLVERTRKGGAQVAPLPGESEPSVGRAPVAHRDMRSNAATTIQARLAATLTARDFDALPALLSEDYQEIDHPTGSCYGRADAIASLQRLFRSGDPVYREEPLATLGDALCFATKAGARERRGRQTLRRRRIRKRSNLAGGSRRSRPGVAPGSLRARSTQRRDRALVPALHRAVTRKPGTRARGGDGTRDNDAPGG